MAPVLAWFLGEHWSPGRGDLFSGLTRNKNATPTSGLLFLQQQPCPTRTALSTHWAPAVAMGLLVTAALLCTRQTDRKMFPGPNNG